MNFRITALFFGLLLTMLWVFGLMIAHKKASGDPGLVAPKLASKDAKDINKVHIKSKDIDAEFDRIGDHWYLMGEANQKVKVMGYHIDAEILDKIKAAKNDDSADVSKEPSHYGLDRPKVTVTISGKYKGEDKEWKFFVGNESGGMLYVNSSDRPDKVFAVPKRSLEKLFVKDANYLRDKRLFDFVDTAVTTIIAKKGDKELELKRGDGNRWDFVKPKYGFAGFEIEQEEPKDPHKKDLMPKLPVGGVKGLLKNIAEVRVEAEGDFVPLGKAAGNFGVEKGKEKMLVQITSTQDKKDTSEILYIGDMVKEDKTEYYYARLDSDDGIMKINARWIEPLIKALDDPGKIRSRDVAAFDKKQVDAVIVKEDKAKTEFFKSGEKAEFKMPPFAKFQPPDEEATWQMVIGSEKHKASDAAVNTLIELVRGPKGIVKFHDGTEAELKRKEAEWGLDKNAVEVSIYLNSLDKDKKEKKKEEKKKDDKKDPKKAEPAKEHLPGLKDGAKPEITLAIGSLDKDKTEVNVRRTLKDGTVTYFTMKKAIREKVEPPEGIELAYLDLSAPKISVPEIVSIKLQRATDKGQEVIDLEQRDFDGRMRWFSKDKTEPPGYKLSEADQSRASILAGELAGLRVKKWLRKLDEATDAAKFGPKGAPIVAATVLVHKRTADYAASVVAAFALPDSLVTATCGAILERAADKFDDGKSRYDTITIELGKETEVVKDQPGAYAKHSGTKFLFLCYSSAISDIKKIDVRDRSFLLYAQPELDASTVGAIAGNPLSLLMIDSPFINGAVQRFSPADVKEVRLAVHTPAELRKFVFERKMKEQPKPETKEEKAKPRKIEYAWIDKSTGLYDFKLDPDKVATVVKEFAKLRTDRFVAIVGGPRPEQKLTDNDAAVKLELVMADNSVVTVMIGSSYLHYGHYATSSAWTGSDGKTSAVFFLPASLVNNLLRGTEYFAKERTGE